jgi:ketosteroid isomerase-like protein
MSQENVETVRHLTDAWNRGDLDGWLAGFAPEAELHTPAGSRIGGYIGGVRGWSGTGQKSTRTLRK